MINPRTLRAKGVNKTQYINIMNTRKNINLEELIKSFSKNQTLKNIEDLKNVGIGLKQLKNNKWERLTEYKLPFDRWILLYNDNLELSDIGVY